MASSVVKGICIFLVCMALSGCGQGEEQAQEEKISLTMMTTGYVGADFEKEIKEKYPNVELNVEQYSEEQYYTRLKTRLATGNGPDFFVIQQGYAGSNGVENLAAAGYLLPVEDESSMQNWKGREDSLLAAGGNIYGISQNRIVLGVCYNKEIFDENALEVPRCWEDFLECCRRLKEKGIQPLLAGYKNKTSHQFGLYQIVANQIYAENPQYDQQLLTGETHFTDPGAWDHALEMYITLYREGYIQKSAVEMTNDEAKEQFYRGEGAMIMLAQIYGQDTLPENVGFFPLPANNRGDQLYCSMGETGGIGIYSGTDHTELCKKILRNVVWDSMEQEAGETFSHTSYQDLPYFYLCNQGWPHEVEIVMEDKLQEYFTDSQGDIEDITRAMQRELEK